METITLETKKEICEAYKDPNLTIREIAGLYSVSVGSVSTIALEMGAEPRLTAARKPRKKRDTTARTCPKCHKTIDVKGASFCCFCGADIRSKKELLIERIHNAMRTIKLLPESARDEIQILYLDIITELRKEV